MNNQLVEKHLCKRREPVPSHFHDAIEDLVNEGKIDESSVLVINYPKYKYSSLKEPDISLLSAEELQVIDGTINRISHFLSKEISEYSHGDIPWRLAKEGEPLNYEAVFYRDPEYSVRDYDEWIQRVHIISSYDFEQYLMITICITGRLLKMQ